MNTPAIYGDDFLPDLATKMYDEGKAHPGVDYIIGTTSDEASMFISLNLNPETVSDLLKNGIEYDHPFRNQTIESVIMFMRMKDHPLAGKLRNFLENRYFKDKDDRIGNIRGPLDAVSDQGFIAPMIGTANALSRSGHKVYVYWFDQVSKVRLFSEYVQLLQADLIEPESKVTFGVSHAVDLFYTFGHGLVADVPLSVVDEMPREDKLISGSMVHSWTTFTKTG